MPTTKTLYIKNMVCPRCIRVVREDLEDLGLKVTEVALGKAVIEYQNGSVSDVQIKQKLERAGFEILEDKDQRIIESIKVEVVNLLNDPALKRLTINNSDYLEKKIGINYGSLSRLFSQHMGITIEKYLITCKIEKVKELLKYEEMTSEEIAFQLGYSSIAHLSKQFKDVTGMTITAFRKENSIKQ